MKEKKIEMLKTINKNEMRLMLRNIVVWLPERYIENVQQFVILPLIRI